MPQEQWAVVNFSQMQLALPRDSGAAKLTVVICKKDDREVWVRRYYTGSLRANAKEIYEKKLRQLRAEKKASQAAMADLRSQLERANEAAILLAGELAKAQTANSAELRTRALTLFLAGKVDEALALLNQETSRLQRVIADQHMLRGEMYASKFQFDEAEKSLLEAHKSLNASFGAEHKRTQDVITALGDLYESWGKPENAATW